MVDLQRAITRFERQKQQALRSAVEQHIKNEKAYQERIKALRARTENLNAQLQGRPMPYNSTTLHDVLKRMGEA